MHGDQFKSNNKIGTAPCTLLSLPPGAENRRISSR